jgi:membrane-bound lytic murein transglycosylase D
LFYTKNKTMLNRKLKVFFAGNALLLITLPAGSHLKLDTPGMEPAYDNVKNISSSASSFRLNKQAKQFVKDYIRRNDESLSKIRIRSEAYFPMMDSVFALHGMPVELKYLAVVESELKSTATSRVGAKGPWQFMPATAKIMGLKITKHYDERTSYRKSTRAAARYLKDLYSEYNDWLLVLAAYNGGPGPVNKAIKRSGSRNFWKLQQFLPAESRGHVKKFIATHYYFEGQGGWTTLTKAETQKLMKEVAEAVASAQ